MLTDAEFITIQKEMLLAWKKKKRQTGGTLWHLDQLFSLRLFSFFHAVLCQCCSSCSNLIASKSADDTNLGGQRANRQTQAVEWPGGSWGCRQCLGDSISINICLNTHEELDIWTSEHLWYYGISCTEWGD